MSSLHVVRISFGRNSPADCKDIVQVSILLGDRKLLPSECIQCSQIWISGVDCLLFSVKA